MSVSHSPFGDFHLRTPIPYFSGEHVEWWIYHVECFFYHRPIILEQKFSWVEVYFMGEALQWYRGWIWNAHRSWRVLTWEDFVIDLKKRFTVTETTYMPTEELDFFNKTLDEVKHHLSEMQALTSAYLSNLSQLKSQMVLNPISKLTATAKESHEAGNDCSYEVGPQVSVSDDGQLQWVTKDTTEAVSTIYESTDETKEMSVTSQLSESKLEDGTIFEPIIFRTLELPTEVHSSYLLDDTGFVIAVGCVESGNVASSVVLDAFSFFCTLGVCENVYEAFLYLKLKCHWYQRENIYMVVNVVSFLLDWVEKPPPFPPDLTRSNSIYHGCLSLIEVKCIRMRDYGFGLNLCFVLDVVLLVFEEYYCNQHGLRHDVYKYEAVSGSHCDSMPKVYQVFQRPKEGSICRVLKAIQFPTGDNEGMMSLMLEISSIQEDVIWLTLIAVDDASIFMRISRNFNNIYPMKWTLLVGSNKWYLSERIGMIMVHHLCAMLMKSCRYCFVILFTATSQTYNLKILHVSDYMVVQTAVCLDALANTRTRPEFRNEVTCYVCLETWNDTQWLDNTDVAEKVFLKLHFFEYPCIHFFEYPCIKAELILIKLLVLWNCNITCWSLKLTLYVSETSRNSLSDSGCTVVAVYTCGVQMAVYTCRFVDKRIICGFEECKWSLFLDIFRKEFEHGVASHNHIRRTILEWNMKMGANGEVSDYLVTSLCANLILMVMVVGLSPRFDDHLIHQTTTCISLCMINKAAGLQAQWVLFLIEVHLNGLGWNETFIKVQSPLNKVVCLCLVRIGQNNHVQTFQRINGLESVDMRLSVRACDFECNYMVSIFSLGLLESVDSVFFNCNFKTLKLQAKISMEQNKYVDSAPQHILAKYLDGHVHLSIMIVWSRKRENFDTAEFGDILKASKSLVSAKRGVANHINIFHVRFGRTLTLQQMIKALSISLLEVIYSRNTLIFYGFELVVCRSPQQVLMDGVNVLNLYTSYFIATEDKGQALGHTDLDLQNDIHMDGLEPAHEAVRQLFDMNGVEGTQYLEKTRICKCSFIVGYHHIVQPPRVSQCSSRFVWFTLPRPPESQTLRTRSF